MSLRLGPTDNSSAKRDVFRKPNHRSTANLGDRQTQGQVGSIAVGRALLPQLQRLAGNRAVSAVLARRTRTEETSAESGPVVQRSSLPFDSHTEIHHNVLQSREFALKAGEGVVVELEPDWYANRDGDSGDEHDPVDRVGPDAPPGLTGNVRVTLENLEWLDESKGRCTATIGSWNELVLKTDEDGEHQLVLDIGDHNHNFYLDGPIHVRQANSAELADACQGPGEARTGKEVLHDVLALAGLLPVLGIVADAADTGLYMIDGNWAQAGISAAAMIPVFGDAATLVKFGERAAVKITKTAAKRIERRTVGEALKETREALKQLRTPPALKHPGNRLGIDVDARLVEMAKETRVTQAGISREAFGAYNVATARVRVGKEIRYLDAGNSPGQLMHSEDWLITQVEGLRKQFGRKNVTLEQLFSERIPCGECLSKLERIFNAEIFYTVAQRGSRATDLMKAYGVR